MEQPHYYLDLDDAQNWLIKSRSGERFTAGFDKEKVKNLIDRLNKCHRPSVHNTAFNEIVVCWNDHEKHEPCDYVKEI